MQIINNFLPQEIYQNIKDNILSDHFPWFFNENVLSDRKSTYQFTHTFYVDQNAHSSFCELLKPIMDILKPQNIVRVKANLNPQTEKIIETGLHTDSSNDKLKSAVFFLNTCDGYCKINNKKFFSQDNTMLIFNSNIDHTGSTTTNKKRRVLINIIYSPSL